MPSESVDFAQVAVERGNAEGLAPSLAQKSCSGVPLKATSLSEIMAQLVRVSLPEMFWGFPRFIHAYKIFRQAFQLIIQQLVDVKI